jgi:alpha-glucosidase (family GH31 glycosyl hydrolase)
MPTVVAMGLGLAASGVPVFTHDVAGYQSVGNPPSTKELWFRWASLGAFTPILRTHHGAFEADNWQFDSDADTIAHWARVATEHMRLFPYRYGLAAKAAADGTPMILPPAVYGGDWGRTDAWLLGQALLVAPITTAGATGRDVALPPDTSWYDWWTRQPVQSGFFAADVDEIPVFAAAGTTVPVFAQVPQTLVPTDAYVDLADADTARIVYLFAGGGRFVEADGTTYAPSGAPTGPGEATATLAAGTIDVSGVSLAIDGPVERTYTVVVIP